MISIRVLNNQLFAVLLCTSALAACSATNEGSTGSGGSGGLPTGSGGQGGGGNGSGGNGAGGSMAKPAFPSDPIIDMPSVPANAPDLFGPPASGDPSGGPCMSEPEDQVLIPRNWLALRFRFQPMGAQNLFEIRLHSESEPNDLVVYTDKNTWTIPASIWQAMTQNLADKDISISVRGAVFDGTQLSSAPAMGSKLNVRIAPVSAAGNIVYWTTTGGSSLKGFAVGSTSVVPVLAPNQVEMNTTNNAEVTCVGCHTSTPDGKYASFTAQGPWANAIASIEQATVGKMPPFLGAGAIAALSQPEMGIHTYSQAHWKDGDRIKVAPLGAFQNSKLAWIDLEAVQSGEGTAWGVIPRNGDARGVGAPTWSHDGNTIVYVSTNAQTTGRLDNGDADLYSVPFNNKGGGMASPLPGASDPGLEEYYPAFSPDDKYIIFNRIPNGNNMYDQPKAELFVLPSAGGSPLRLKANDPAACSGKSSPGITNSWARWSPEASSDSNRMYYWLVFSSRRGPKGNPQLYLSAVVDEGGTLSTYGSLYFWNQPEDESNHTPAWDVFQIPIPQ